MTAITGETGAGKTILTQAVGLLLGAKGDASIVGAAGTEAYVEAELDVPDGFFDDDELSGLAELAPEDEPGLVLARRVFGDGRTRAYAWGRAVAREDLAAAAERLIAMSGQFEQRRLGRPSYQLDVLDSFVGEEQQRRRREARVAWRELAAARRRHDELTRGAAAEESRLRELAALVEATEGFEPGGEQSLRDERERLRHVTELAEGAARAAEAIAPDEGEGATGLAAAAERSLAPLERLAPELAHAGEELRDVELRLREVGSDLRAFLASLEAEPDRLEHVEGELERISDARRRFGAADYDDLLARATAARDELAALEGGLDPAAAAAEALAAAETRTSELAVDLRNARQASVDAFAEAVAEELRGVGMGEGEFRVELRERDPGPTGADEAVFLIRPNAGLPVRAGGRDSIRRRALTRRARDRRRGRWGDHGLRRDRRRRRRRDGARRRSDAEAAGRARAGADDHAPAADRQRGRHPLPGREGARRPHPHADRAARRRAAPRRARAHARRQGIHLDARDR